MNRTELEAVIIGYTKERRNDIETALDEYTREVQRAAWDEGYIAGWRNGNDYLSALNVNPYEKEADR